MADNLGKEKWGKELKIDKDIKDWKKAKIFCLGSCRLPAARLTTIALIVVRKFRSTSAR